MRQNVPRLAREGELERYVGYAARRECEAVFITVDADKTCPREVSEAWNKRVTGVTNKTVAIALFKAEFENMFLCCLDGIATAFPEYGWDLESWSADDDHEAVVGAKGALSRRMRKGRAYKETRDQARFVSALDLEKLRQRSRSFQHFETTVLALAREGKSRR